MSSGDSLQLIYANAMRQHPFGFALYHPIDKDVLKLGSCGYLNDLGDWNPITNVSSAVDNRYVAVDEELQKGDPQELNWGPKCSDHVTEHREKLKAEMAIPGIPTNVNVFCKYASNQRFGAVLLTTPPVIKSVYYHDMPFLKWFKTNAATIVRNHPEVKQHGLWIVTSTYSTSKCALNAWTSKSKEVAVGFSGTMSQMAGLDVKGSWYTSSDDGGWNYFEQKDKQVVVFIGGLHFRYSKMIAAVNAISSESRQMPSFRRTFRGDSGEGMIYPPIHVDGDEPYEIICERWSIEERGESDDGSW